MVLVLVLAVVEVLLQPRADHHPEVGGYRHVAPVEQGVDVGAQKEAVIDSVGAAFAHGLDVGSLEDREDLLAGDGATLLVDVGNEEAEGSLA